MTDRPTLNTTLPLSPLGGGVATSLLVLLLVVLPVRAQEASPVQSLLTDGAQANADPALLEAVATRAEQAGLSPQQTATLLRPAVTLAQQDLPSTPLLNKTLEGLAKRVPPQRMEPVLQQLQSHTTEAGALVSSWTRRPGVQSLLTSEGEPPPTSRNRLITSIAEARQQNVPLNRVQQFLESLPGAVRTRPVSLSNVAVAVSVLPDLPAAASSGAAQNLLTTALGAGYDAESLRQLPTALKQAQRGSARPPAALARGTARAIKTGAPASRVLQDLFRGAVPSGPPSGTAPGAPDTPPGQSTPPDEAGRPPDAGPPSDPGETPSPPPNREGPPDGRPNG